MRCAGSLEYQEADIMDMFQEWIYLHGIFPWQRKYGNVRMSAARLMVTVECALPEKIDSKKLQKTE